MDKHPSTRPFIVQENANVYWLDFTIVSNHHTVAVIELFKTYFDHSNRKEFLPKGFIKETCSLFNNKSAQNNRL